MGKPTILLQMGDQLDDSPFLANQNINAILWGGYLGQNGGAAVMNVLFGKTVPARRLPVTQYPAAYVNEVPMPDMNLRLNANSGNPGRTYKWYNGSVLPFGFGLHYTNFSVEFGNGETAATMFRDPSSLVLNCTTSNSTKYFDLRPFASVPISVRNTGSVASDFVALLFLAGEFGKRIGTMRISCRPSLAVLVTIRWQHKHLAGSLTGDTNQNGNMYEEAPARAFKVRCKGGRLKHSTLAINLPIPYLATDH
jgi:hypothetical protein